MNTLIKKLSPINMTLSGTPFSLEAQSLQVGSIYEHYKGKLYKILCIGRHSETSEEYVVYQALYENQDIWIRPLSMFLEEIILDEKRVPRFKLIK